MTLLYSFLFSGFICVIGQIILENTHLTPGHVTALFVVLGTFLDIYNLYDKIILKVGGGALVPITSFGHLLMHGSYNRGLEEGYLGLALGMFDLTASGITIAVVSAFVAALLFKPKN